jgi:hypothetical protein
MSTVTVHSSSYYSRLRSVSLGARHMGCVEKASDRRSARDAGARLRTSGSAAIKLLKNNSIPTFRNRYSPGCPPEQTKTSIMIFIRGGGGLSTFQWCSVVDSTQHLIAPRHCVFQSHCTRSWLGDSGRSFDHHLRLRTGLVLHIGTW